MPVDAAPPLRPRAPCLQDAAKDEQTAFIAVYSQGADGAWRTVLEETEIPGKAKFEGLEVLSWGAGAPQ